MGSSYYNSDSRSRRSKTMNFASNSLNENFTQNEEKKAHESMLPRGIDKREARDSALHPYSFPIILALDETGSMLQIPQTLIIDGLPHIMEKIIQTGNVDPSVLFLAIGDHETDQYPLQVGQFESGDLELDTWLTRSYLEGNGGGNKGESYLLAWYFGAFHTVTDSWEKRKQKGLLFTIGDEPCLPSLPANRINELMGTSVQVGYTDKQLLEEASKIYDVYHIHVSHTPAAKDRVAYWKNLLGERCIEVHGAADVPPAIVKIVTSMKPVIGGVTQAAKDQVDKKEQQIIL